MTCGSSDGPACCPAPAWCCPGPGLGMPSPAARTPWHAGRSPAAAGPPASPGTNKEGGPTRKRNREE